jgi:hypothetical protein
MKRLLGLTALVILAGATLASAVTVDFEDLGVPPGSQVFDSTTYSSRGFVFTSGPDAFQVPGMPDHLHVGSRVTWGYNGTTILLPHGHAVMTAAGGQLFSLRSVDLAGFPANLEDPVHVIGTYADDSTVTHVLTLDGLVDGPGNEVDFESFVLPSSFTGLQRVDFKLNGTGNGNFEALMGIDDLDATAVPEPTSIALLALGLMGGAGGRRLARREAGKGARSDQG